jgi:hypothetical protein
MHCGNMANAEPQYGKCYMENAEPQCIAAIWQMQSRNALRLYWFFLKF